MKQTWISRSREETEAVGAAVAALLRPRLSPENALILRLDGEMGVGKTTFAAGVCRAFGISRTKSPTYTVVNEYRGEIDVFHFDLYRLSDLDDLLSIGFEDYLCRGGLLLVEWADAIEGAVPRDVPTVSLCRTDDGDGREIILDMND